jgi:glycosyltransferase involved in cell wall biosynthesis
LPVGEMSREITTNIQSTAKFVVVPSSWDVLNLTAVEAMDAGKVVICSEGAGVCDLITHGENGFRFPANDPRRLAELLTEVDKLSPGVRVKIGQRARDTVRHELDPNRICAIRANRYRRLSESKAIVRQRHRWLDSLFGSNIEEPFEPLADIPLTHIAKLAFWRGWRRLQNAIR